ncbi:MAG: AAA-like domain-containing protein [Clostridiales bacterium]|nr:AAA-like domain-containing protein [Clostridiales bacterium]
MAKVFNVSGACRPSKHYMVDLKPRLKKTRVMIEAGEYFTINKARQYGKTTLLRALADDLQDGYIVISLDFQKMSSMDFAGESAFVNGLAREVNGAIKNTSGVPEETRESLQKLAGVKDGTVRLADLFECFSEWCSVSEKPVVLMIDEVDTAADNQVFLDFLAQLRAYYLYSDVTPTFQSVILASLYDIRNVKRKIRSEKEHKTNSPWNIAADFLVDMSFSKSDIAGMLNEYDNDYHIHMDINEISSLLYDYTSGYPYLVSRLCKFLDERIAGNGRFKDRKDAWTKAGFLDAVKLLINEMNPLYQSLKGKLEDYPELRTVLYELLFTGKPIPYSAMNDYIEMAAMFGFVKNENGTAVVSNRIFETVLYNWFMSEEYVDSKIYEAGLQEKNQFVTGGHLNIRRVLEKFVESFHYLYGDQNETFLEDVGRRYFMLFLKPIINGVGNSYVEAETRNRERMDLVIDYHGERFIIEMKVWRGNAYNERGENQLVNYLNYFGLNKGYMVSFDFNKKKEIGVKDVVIGDKLLIEAVV